MEILSIFHKVSESVCPGVGETMIIEGKKKRKGH